MTIRARYEEARMKGDPPVGSLEDFANEEHDRLQSSLSKLQAENERLRKELKRLTFRLAELEDIPATCPLCGQSGDHVHSGELP